MRYQHKMVHTQLNTIETFEGMQAVKHQEVNWLITKRLRYGRTQYLDTKTQRKSRKSNTCVKEHDSK